MVEYKDLVESAMYVQDDVLDGESFYEVAQSMVWSAVDQHKEYRTQSVEDLLGNDCYKVIKDCTLTVEKQLREDFNDNEDEMLLWAKGE
tara:strand:- start:387 stop:653 length:267 start_codon:yes stop_codon:yes gene_type:complete